MHGETSAGISQITKPAVNAASKAARADKIKSVKVSVKIKKKAK